MKREFLKELGIEEEAINKIMAENGRDINNAKADNEKNAAELEQAKAELLKAQETLEKFKDYDNVKADVEKYKAEFETSKRDYENKIASMELSQRVKDFTNNYKFVNDMTRDAINSQLAAALSSDEAKGKSLDDIFKGITDGKENIFINENKPIPPTVTDMSGDKSQNDDDAAIRAVMGLPAKK